MKGRAMQNAESIRPNTSPVQPSAPSGRLVGAVLIAGATLLAQAALGNEPASRNDPNAPYAGSQPAVQLPQNHQNAQTFPARGHQGAAGWTGLKIAPGTAMTLIFGSDPYHDGAALAAVLRGLEVGDVLRIERTEAGVRLRRQGDRTGSAYDDLEFDHQPWEQEP
jgi:hypothetical protein